MSAIVEMSVNRKGASKKMTVEEIRNKEQMYLKNLVGFIEADRNTCFGRIHKLFARKVVVKEPCWFLNILFKEPKAPTVPEDDTMLFGLDLLFNEYDDDYIDNFLSFAYRFH